jgi:DNA-binding response OmpR family regulator
METQAMLEGAESLPSGPGAAVIQEPAVGPGVFMRGGSMNILIVEDEAVAAAALEATLTEARHKVVGAVSSAREALEIAAMQTVDLALLDINLNGRRDGVELARELLVVHGVPALFLSGDGNKARGGGDVAIAYLRKPYTDQEVLAAIEVAQGIIESERRAAGEPGLELF